MDAAERELFARSIATAAERHAGAPLDDALVEVGWRDALTEDRRTAVSVLFEAQGLHNATSTALDAVTVDALGLEVGVASVAVALPAAGSWTTPAVAAHGRASVDALVLGALARDDVLVVARSGQKDAAFVGSMAAFTVEPVRGIDPTLGLRRVQGDVVVDDEQAVRWPAAVAAGQVALAHELVGASRAMLALARQHALDREQFGRPIAGFQAVRHRLAETLVAIETADAAVAAAWEDPSPASAAIAKAVAGRGARTAARHCQQVLAGVGYTAEHPFHRFFRRTLVLDQLLGSARALTRQLGTDVIATRQLPRPLPL